MVDAEKFGVCEHVSIFYYSDCPKLALCSSVVQTVRLDDSTNEFYWRIGLLYSIIATVSPVSE